MKVSAAADKTIEDYTGGAGLVKSDANGVVSPAAAGTDYVTGSSTNTFTNKTIDANGTGNSISNLETADFASGVIDTDATLSANSDTKLATQKAVKAYADAISQGIRWKQPVRAATTVAGTLASSFENGDIIDNVTLATGDRILIKDQSTGSENGIYIVNASGAPSRASDADTATELKGMVVDVQEGTVNAETAWILTNDSITLGSTALTYVDFVKANVPSASTTVQGKVELADSTEAEAKSSSSLALTPASVVNFPIKKTFTIGNGSSTTITCTHNLNTKDVIVSVRDASTDEHVIADIASNNVNSVDIIFAVAPASNSYKVVIIG
jgi:hypothetical protein